MIKVVTDTLSDIPQDVADEYRIPLIPVYVVFGQETFRERFDLSSEEFCRRLVSSPQHPTTSQPSVGDFLRFYQDALADDPDATILSIHLASTLSGTIESARQAAAQLKADIHIFDTLSGSLAEGLMVVEAARLARTSHSLEAILARLAAMRDGMQLYLTPETLGYLAKGGRIGRAAHLVGTMLDIKPLLRLRGGIIEPYERHRTRRRVVTSLRDLVLRSARGKPGLHLAVGHFAAEEEARRLADELLAELEPESFLFGSIGAAIGAHLGPGTLGAGWWLPAE